MEGEDDKLYTTMVDIDTAKQDEHITVLLYWAFESFASEPTSTSPRIRQ